MRVLDAYDITDATLFSSNVAEADYSAWLAGATYALGDRVIRTSTHRIYENQSAGISIVAPEDDAATWREVQPTNRWAMLGRSVAWATSNASSINVYITPGAVGDIVLLGLAGTQVQIFSGATGATLVRTVAIPAPVAPSTTSQLVITGLGITAGNRVGIVITGTGAVQCAHLGVGTFVDMGQTLAGPQVSMTDFSRVETDDFGVITVTRRKYSRKLQGQVNVTAAAADAVIARVEALRAVVCYWSMVDTLDCMGGLAIVRDFRHTSVVASTVSYALTLETLARDDLVIAPGFTGAADTALPTLPRVTGLRISVIPGGYTLVWDKADAAGYVGTEVRAGTSWDVGALVFFGAARQHSVFWPAVGSYTYLFKHTGLGIESDQATGLRVTVNADGTIGAQVVWVTSAGVVQEWGLSGGGVMDWGDATLGYLYQTPQLGAHAATDVISANTITGSYVMPVGSTSNGATILGPIEYTNVSGRTHSVSVIAALADVVGQAITSLGSASIVRSVTLRPTVNGSPLTAVSLGIQTTSLSVDWLIDTAATTVTVELAPGDVLAATVELSIIRGLSAETLAHTWGAGACRIEGIKV